ALDELARDADHDLAGHRFGHVLGRFERAVAGLDHRLDVGDRSSRHGGRRLRLPPHSQDFAIEAVSADHQDLDQVGSDVQHGEVTVVVAPLAEEFEFRHSGTTPRASSRRFKASSALPLSVPRASCGRPPPLPRRAAKRAASYSGVRSLDTLITNWSPATTVTTPVLTRSRYRSA